jgi:hypothetical protein
VKLAPLIFVGGLGVAVCGGLLSGCGNAVDHRPATWSYISPVIIQPNCATTSCHSQAAAVSGLDFSDPHRGYASLTRLWVWVVDGGALEVDGGGCGPVNNTVVCEQRARPLVTPYDPGQSRLIDVLRARGAPRMPPDRPLIEDDIRLIERWIYNGAQGPETDVAAAGDAAASDAGAADAADAPSGATDGASERSGDGAAAAGDAAGAGG